MATKKKDQHQQEQQPPALLIEWNIPDHIITRFATNIIVQTIENAFKISFFEIKPPIMLSDEDRAKLRDTGTIRADCVGSIIVTPDRLATFINAMNEHLSKYKNAQEKKKS